MILDSEFAPIPVLHCTMHALATPQEQCVPEPSDSETYCALWQSF